MEEMIIEVYNFNCLFLSEDALRMVPGNVTGPPLSTTFVHF